MKRTEWLNAKKPGTVSALSLPGSMRRDWVRDVTVAPPGGRAGRRAHDAFARQISRRTHKAAIRTDWSGCAAWENGHLVRRFAPVAATP